jgi:hypothetical protein
MTSWGCTSPLESIGWRFTNLGTSCTGFWVETTPSAGGSFTVYLWAVSGPTLLHAGQLVSAPLANTRYSFNWSGGPITLTPGADYVLSIDKGNSSCYYGQGSAATPSVPGFYTGVDQRWALGSGTFPTTTGLGVQPAFEPTICGGGVPSTPAAPVVDTQPPTLNIPTTPSCSTTADVCLRLQQLNEKVDWLIRTAPLVQNQSIAEGTAHSGLTGTGTIAVSGIRGVRAELTTVPAYYGGSGTNPEARYGVGRIDLETPEGWFERHFLNESPLLVSVTNPNISAIGYTLNAGVVLKITELVQGP